MRERGGDRTAFLVKPQKINKIRKLEHNFSPKITQKFKYIENIRQIPIAISKSKCTFLTAQYMWTCHKLKNSGRKTNHKGHDTQRGIVPHLLFSWLVNFGFIFYCHYLFFVYFKLQKRIWYLHYFHFGQCLWFRLLLIVMLCFDICLLWQCNTHLVMPIKHFEAEK